MSRKVDRSVRIELITHIDDVAGPPGSQALTVETRGGKGVLSYPGVSLTLQHGLRMAFAVEQSLDFTANRCRATIYNLNDTSRQRISGVVRRKLHLTAADQALLASKGITNLGPTEVNAALGLPSVRLSAGYGSDLQMLFEGDCARLTSTKEPTSWVTTLDSEDAGVRIREAVINKTYLPGVDEIQVITDLVRAMGASISPKDRLILERMFATDPLGSSRRFGQHGVTVSGPVLPILEQILYGFEVFWTIQNGRFQVFDRTALLPQPPVEIGPGAGMVGSPELLEADYVRVTTLLNPLVQPGAQVIVDSRSISGAYRVESVQHAGDTHGGTFVSTAICRTLTSIDLAA